MRERWLSKVLSCQGVKCHNFCHKKLMTFVTLADMTNSLINLSHAEKLALNIHDKEVNMNRFWTSSDIEIENKIQEYPDAKWGIGHEVEGDITTPMGYYLEVQHD